MSSFASGLNGDRFTVPTQRAPSSTRGSTGDGHLLFVFMGGLPPCRLTNHFRPKTMRKWNGTEAVNP